VRLLRKLADSGLTILCTIHQPSASLFEQFDRVLLLQIGGQCVYFGDIGENSRTIIQYFETNGAAKCPEKANPAECKLSYLAFE
jgi:ATP-binding cassette subfamily G (WHITE) protein 2 (SNQ2)